MVYDRHNDNEPLSPLFHCLILRYAGDQFSFHAAWHKTLYAILHLPDKLVALYTQVGVLFSY